MKEKIRDMVIVYVKNNFPSWISLFAGNSLIIIGIWSFSQAPYDLKLVISLIACYLYSIIWAKYRFIFPRNEHHETKIGIVFAVEVENNSQKIRLNNDFLTKFNDLLSKNNLKSIVEVICLNEFQSKKVKPVLNNYQEAEMRGKKKSKEINDFKKLNKEMKSHFFIWGNIKEREAGDPSYVFDLNALVVHRQEKEGAKQEVKKAFINSWYKRILFKKSWELFGFELSANMTFLSALYVIGIAALVSDDPFLALRLHKQLLKNLESSIEEVPKFIKVKQEVESLISEENFLIAQIHYFAKDTGKANNSLIEAFKGGKSHYEHYLFESILKFEADDLDAALESIGKAERCAKNSTWRYNKAFLLMVKGNYAGAWSIYRKLGNSSFGGEENVLKQIISYIKQYLKENPDKIQFHFVIGFLYYKKFKKYNLAIKEFKFFLKKVTDSKMNFLKKLAVIYKNKIEKFNS
jgi:tetratricopeptide (TPR) repeat protein